MKTFILSLLFGASALIAQPLPLAAQPVSWDFTWQDTNIYTALRLTNYIPKTNSCYLIVSTNNLAGGSVANWPVFKTVTNWTYVTNSGLVFYKTSIPLQPDTLFFAVLGTNVWGSNALPSNVDQTGPPSSPPVSFQLGRP